MPIRRSVDGARWTARRTIRDGNRASDVITRLRDLFGKKELSLEPVDLNETAREVMMLARSELQRNRVVLQSELGDNLPNVPATVYSSNRSSSICSATPPTPWSTCTIARVNCW